MKRRVATLMMILAVGLGCAASPPREATAAAPRPPREVNLLAMGDWGQVGPNQAGVAATMEKHVRSAGRTFDAMLTAGDNFYPKLTGIDDPKWRTMFEDLYNPHVLNFPFYVALGNHDYDEVTPGGVRKWQIEMDYAKANPNSRWKLPSRWYRVEFPSPEEPLVSVLVIDTYKTLVGEAAWAEQLAWVKAELDKPRKSKWLVAIGHHPLFSNGDHGDNGVVQRDLGALFQQSDLDLYICGHDHDLQHLELPKWKMSFLLVGGGGAATRPMRNDARGPFSKAAFGFADLNFTPNLVTAKYIGLGGVTLHEFTRTKGGKVKVIETVGSDRAVPRKVRDVTRPDAATRSTTTRAATTRAATTKAAHN
jgi:hypothetical protein